MSVGADTLSSLSRLGIVVKRDWLEAAERALREKGVTARDLVDALVEQFLFSDLNLIGHRALPRNVDRMHDCRLTGSFVLQVQEAFNIGEPLERRNKDTSNTCLKLWLTDGHQRVVGFEYRKIAALKVETPVGYKLAIHDVMVKRGILMLCPQAVCVLGGEVASLVKEQEKNRRELARRNQPYYIPGGGDGDEEEEAPQRASLDSYLYGSLGAANTNTTASRAPLKSKAAEKSKSSGSATVAAPVRGPVTNVTVLDLEEDSFDDRDSSMSPPPVIRNPVQKVLPSKVPQYLMEDLESFPEDFLEAVDEDVDMAEAPKSGPNISDPQNANVQLGACQRPVQENIGDDELLELMEDAEKVEADAQSGDVHMADVEDEMDDLDFDFDFEKPSFQLLDLPEEDEAVQAPHVNHIADILASPAAFKGSVRAAVRSSVSMLSVDRLGRFTATVTLEDGSAVCTAVLSSSVIQDHCLGGLSPDEYQRLKNSHTPEAKARLSEAGQLLERNLAQMEGMMVLSFESGLSRGPCQVLELRRPSTDDMDALFAAAGIQRRSSPPRRRDVVSVVAPSPICIEDSPMVPRGSKNALYCSPRPSSPQADESPIIIASPMSKRSSQSPRSTGSRPRMQVRRLIESSSDEELSTAVEDVLSGRPSSSSLVGSNDELRLSACAEGFFDEAKDSCGVAVVFGPNHPYNVSKGFEGGGSAEKAALLAVKVTLERSPKNRRLAVHTYSSEAFEAMNTHMEAWRRTGFLGPNKQLLKQISRVEDKFTHQPTYVLVDSSVNSKTRADALTARALARQVL